jgi:hypothetical protein
VSFRSFVPLALLSLLSTALLLAAASRWPGDADLPPAWDEALYLRTSLRFHRAWNEEGPPALLRSIAAQEEALPPLLPLSTIPFHRVFGESREAARLTLSIYLFVLLLSTGLLSRETGNALPFAALSVFLVATFTGVVNFSREYLMDLPSAATTTAALWAIRRSGGFLRKGASAAAGIATGLALLTKVLSGLFFVGPFAYALVVAIRRGRRAAAGAVLFAAFALAVALPWYALRLRHVVDYVVYFGFGEGSGPYQTATDPSYYLSKIVQEGMGVLPSLAFAATLALLLVSRARKMVDSYLLVWLASGYILLTLLPNKGGERYILALLPPLAALAARFISLVAAPALRGSLVALALLAGTLNATGLTWPGPLSAVTHHHFGTFPHSMPLQPAETRGWPVEPVLDALSRLRDEVLQPPSRAEVDRFLEASRDLDVAAFLDEAYRWLLKREPDDAGLTSYRREVDSGAMDRNGVAASLVGSDEYRERPLKVLVAPDHRVFNAATLGYLAELSRRPLIFVHPAWNREKFLGDYDAAIVKDSGRLAPAHEAEESVAMTEAVESEGTLLPSEFPCPDGSAIRLLRLRRRAR